MNNLIFDCAELMSIDRTLQYLGDSFDYRHVDRMSIKGRITGNYSLNRIKDVWVGQSGFVNYQSGNNIIYLNDNLIGTGRLSSISFEKSTDILEKKYSATVDILRDSNFQLEATGNYYSGLSNFDRFKLLNNFNESQNFSRDTAKTFSLERSLSFSVDCLYKEVYSGDSSSFARSVASGFFAHSNFIPLIESQYPSFSVNQDNANRTIKESYDSIRNEFSFLEKLDFQEGLDYVWEHRNSLSLSSDGVSTVSEDGTIKSSKAVANPFNKIDNANSGWSVVQTGIFGRVENVYLGYSGNLIGVSGCSLLNYPISKSISRDKYNGIIDYSYSYSNNPNLNSGFVYEYEDSISHAKGGYSEFSQNGTIYSLEPNRGSGFSNIKTIFDGTIINDLSSRVSGIYTRYINMLTSGCYKRREMNLINSQISYKKWESRIDFSFTRSDDESIVNTGNIYSVRQSIIDNKPVHLVGLFDIPNDKVLVQKSNQSTIGNYTNSFSVVGKSGVSLSEMLSSCYSKVSKPPGECWIADFGYNYNEFDKKLDMNISYNYSLYRDFESTNV